MPNLYEIIFSSHFSRDREERCGRINRVLEGDWGEIICGVRNKVRDTWECVTDRGLYVVLSADKSFMITCFLSNYSKAQILYDRARAAMPHELRAQIKRNRETYLALYNERF